MMGVKGEVREFLESSTIHGLAHIATGKSIYARIIWVLIVIACFSIGISLIDKAFYSWATTPIITTVDTRPISEVIFPEITVCPPSGTDTVLNMDLEAAKGMELSEEQREELILEMVENLHNEHIGNFLQEQSLFFPLARIKAAYSGEHKFSMGFSSPGYTYDGTTYPDTVKLKVEVEGKGALEGDFSTPGFGDPVVGPDGWPSTEFSYKAKLVPQIYDSSLDGANLVIELNYNTEVSPSGYSTFTDSEASEQIQLETITKENTVIEKTGPNSDDTNIRNDKPNIDIKNGSPPFTVEFSVLISIILVLALFILPCCIYKAKSLHVLSIRNKLTPSQTDQPTISRISTTSPSWQPGEAIRREVWVL